MAVGFDENERRAVIEEIYRAFNDRDMETLMEHLAPGIDWPNVTTGGRLSGRDAFRDYWERQWSNSNPVIAPMRMKFDPDGTAHVVVDQLVRSPAGQVVQNKQVEHVLTFDGAFVTRMDEVELAQGEIDDDDDGDDAFGYDADDGFGGADEGGPGGDGSGG